MGMNLIFIAKENIFMVRIDERERRTEEEIMSFVIKHFREQKQKELKVS